MNTYTNVFLRDIGAPPGGGGGGGGGGIDTTKPRVSRLGMSRKRFKVGKKRTPISAAVKAGTTFRYSLSEESTVRITIERALPGRRARKRSGPCRAPSRSRAKNRKCTRYKRAGTLIRKGKGPGRVSTAFSGRIGRKALKPGPLPGHAACHRRRRQPLQRQAAQLHRRRALSLPPTEAGASLGGCPGAAAC